MVNGSYVYRWQNKDTALSILLNHPMAQFRSEDLAQFSSLEKEHLRAAPAMLCSTPVPCSIEDPTQSPCDANRQAQLVRHKS